MVEETLYSVHSASSPRGFISLKRTVLFVMVHSSFLLHVTLTLQPCNKCNCKVTGCYVNVGHSSVGTILTESRHFASKTPAFSMVNGTKIPVRSPKPINRI